VLNDEVPRCNNEVPPTSNKKKKKRCCGLVKADVVFFDDQLPNRFFKCAFEVCGFVDVSYHLYVLLRYH